MMDTESLESQNSLTKSVNESKTGSTRWAIEAEPSQEMLVKKLVRQDKITTLDLARKASGA